MDVARVSHRSRIDGMASIITSMPLLGDNKPKVRMTGLPPKPEPRPRRIGLDKGDNREFRGR